MDESTCVLIVDDNPAVRTVLRKRLTDQAFHVVEAEDGYAGFARAKQAHPDLILLDIMMPGNGIETYHALKADAETKDIPIVFVSALGNGLPQIQRDGTGTHYFVLGKPYSLDRLLYVVRQALGETHSPQGRATRTGLATKP